MPTPGEPLPLPNPRRPRPRAGDVLSLPLAASAAAAGQDDDADVTEASPGTVPPAAAGSLEPAPEVRRRRRPRDLVHPRRPRSRLSLSPAALALVLLLTLGVGGGLGWVLGGETRTAAPAGRAPNGAAPPATLAPEPAAGSASDPAAEVEAAYAALEAGRPLEGRDRFLALAAHADPGTRAGPALRAAAAWCELAAGRTEAAEGLLVAGLSRASGGENADARFLLGISRLLRGEYAEAEKSFARAAALDPTRSDVHLLWGDTLRREGHPRESVAHYRAALRRNRQETNFGFYRLKLWLAQIQCGGDPAAEAQAAITAVLRPGDDAPPGTALLGAAAGAVAAGNWPEAVEFLRRARRATEPVIFAATLRDSIFAEQRGRPELAEFFAPPR